MEVVVKDVLPRGFSGNVVKPHPGGSQDVAKRRSDLPGDEAHRGQLVVLDRPEIAPVSSRNDERVAARRRRTIEERNNEAVCVQEPSR
jgi:hypothetical protein